MIGGVSLQGGRGNMIGVASGVILLGLVQNILDLANAPNYWIDAIDGAVILVALGTGQADRRRGHGRMSSRKTAP